MTNEERCAIELKVVRHLIQFLAKHGWVPYMVFDSEEHEAVKTEQEALDVVFSVDESTIFFTKGSSHHSVFIVLGNTWDVVADWGYFHDDSDGFNALMEKAGDEIEEMQK